MTASIHRVVARDGVGLHVEAEGEGPPLLLVHEVAATLRSWDLQVAHLRAHHRCVRYDARGYGGSDVPRDASSYSQEQAADDLVAVLDGLGLQRVSAVGFSMGGFALMHAMLRAPEKFASVVVVGVGYGSHPDDRPTFQHEMSSAATRFLADPRAAAEAYAGGPTRRQLLEKSPERWQALLDDLAGHDPVGQSHTFSEVLGKRPSLLSLSNRLAEVQVPMMLVVGDEDDGCLETNLFLKRNIASSALSVLPRTGHTPNLEDPDRFNALVSDFLAVVEAGTWRPRAAGSTGRGLVGM